MSVNPRVRDVVRQMWPKPREPRTKSPKNPGESRTRQLVAARSGGWCEVCGTVRAESVHHRRKRSQGGPWSASNCVHACGDGARGCHGWAESRVDEAAAAGFHLRPGEDAGARPVVSGLHGRVLLADDGSLCPTDGVAS